MPKPENLVRNEDRTPEQRRANGRKGGIASGKARREKRALQDIARIVLDMPCDAGDVDDIAEMVFSEYPDANLTVGQVSILAIAKKARKGDVYAMQFLRDTAGEKPVERVEVNADVAKAASEIADMVRKAKERGDGR